MAMYMAAVQGDVELYSDGNDVGDYVGLWADMKTLFKQLFHGCIAERRGIVNPYFN